MGFGFGMKFGLKGKGGGGGGGAKTDIFGDGSGTSLFTFDNTLLDNDELFTPVMTGTEKYSTGRYANGLDLDLAANVRYNDFTPQLVNNWSLSMMVSTPSSNTVTWEYPVDFNGLNIMFNSTQLRLNYKSIVNSGGLSFTPDNNLLVGTNADSHLVLTHDGATITMYIDGVFVADTPLIELIPTDYIQFGGNGFDGIIDQVRTFNKVISLEEIAILGAEDA